ncbi:type VI secretion system protein ImpF [Chitinivorax tropicus]|uniref:Type VI secretion system protein ImpF n=1 Tax=Chitinivorax tropicus TaxID=714531 RepID=A0A840MU73_9PROT|nr:type VI secretion system protein ImpF [Chitinivorax tropicus]
MIQRGFAPTLFEKLFDDEPKVPSEVNPLRRLNVEQLKESVAKDLEALLNSRRGFGGELESFPQAKQSILSFGIIDFVGMSLSNPDDCHRICSALEETIYAHEMRLQNVKVSLDAAKGSTNSLVFSISALLVVHPAQEPVSFDAFLQPTTQQYSVNQARRIRA